MGNRKLLSHLSLLAFVLLIALAAPALLTGCGGGGGGDSAPKDTIAKVTVNWPARSRDVNAPASALSAIVIFTPPTKAAKILLPKRGVKESFGNLQANKGNTTGADVYWTVNRDTSTAAAYTTVTSSPQKVKIGKQTLIVGFYSGADATGDLVAIASIDGSLNSDGTGLPALDLYGNISAVEVAPIQILVGETAPVNVAVHDVLDGINLAVSPGSLFVSVVDGADKVTLTDGNTRFITGIAPGAARVRVTIDGVVGEADVTVIAPTPTPSPATPTPPPINPTPPPATPTPPPATLVTLQDFLYDYNTKAQTITQAALSPTDAWVILVGKNGYAYRGVPSGLATKLQQLNAQQSTINAVALGPNDSYAVIYDNNGYAYNGIPTDMANAIQTYNSQGKTINKVAIGPNDRYAVVFGGYGYSARGPQGFLDRLTSVNAGQYNFSGIAFGDGDSWAVTYGTNGWATNSVPTGLTDNLTQIHNNGNAFTSVALGVASSYCVTYGTNGYAVNATRSAPPPGRGAGKRSVADWEKLGVHIVPSTR